MPLLSTLSSGVGLLAQTGFQRPDIDYHAFAPEFVLVATLVVVLFVDLIRPHSKDPLVPAIAGLGVLGSMIPIITLAVDGGERFLFDGAYVVDNFSLILKGLFVITGYVVILMSSNYIAEGDYDEGEYYFLLIASVLGMTIMASARDLISIFIALELLSIPAYMLAGWRKQDLKGNEAGIKYFLMGVFASAIMLYGFSLLFGVTGDTRLEVIGATLQGTTGDATIVTLAIVFAIIGFAFKVSAVPFHTWAPDTYQGAPTPITAFLAVASKAAGFVALLMLARIAFAGRPDIVEPMMWVLAALSMTIGNVIALRQTNVIRMLAYSGVAQAGFMLAPLAVSSDLSVGSVVTYLVIYAAMNLGAFAVVMGIARKTRSAEISTFGGLYEYAPGLTVMMTAFLFSLAGIPPLGGWLAKFVIFRALADVNTASGYVLGAVVAVNSVIALYYYANVAREMWMRPVPDGDRTPIVVPFAIQAAIVMSVIATLVFGVSDLATRLGDEATFLLASFSP